MVARFLFHERWVGRWQQIPAQPIMTRESSRNVMKITPESETGVTMNGWETFSCPSSLFSVSLVLGCDIVYFLTIQPSQHQYSNTYEHQRYHGCTNIKAVCWCGSPLTAHFRSWSAVSCGFSRKKPMITADERWLEESELWGCSGWIKVVAADPTYGSCQPTSLASRTGTPFLSFLLIVCNAMANKRKPINAMANTIFSLILCLLAAYSGLRLFLLANRLSTTCRL